MVTPRPLQIVAGVLIALVAMACLVLGYQSWNEPREVWGTPDVTTATLDTRMTP